MLNLNPNNIIPFGVDPSRAELAIVSINERPTLFKIRNNQDGHREFLKRVVKMKEETGKTPVFAIEGNSPFVLGFTFQAYRLEFPTYEITPYHLHEVRNLLLGEDQNDYRDAKAAAMAITQLPQLLKPVKNDLLWFALKVLVSTRLRLVRDQTRDINLLHNHLSQIWGPVYKKFFPILNSPQALTFFSTFPTPVGVYGAEEEVLNLLQAQGLLYYRVKWGKKKVKEIKAEVKEMDWKRDEYLTELGLIVKSFATDALKRLRRIKEIEERLKEKAKGWKEGEISLLRTIPGFDWVLACSVVVLIGDLSRFERKADFIAYCGLVLCSKESGKKKGKKKRKRRNKLLSHLFYQAALASLRSSELSRKYYQKKLQEGKKGKQAIRALAKKLAEITYAVLKNKEPYDETRLLN
ncbi:MAG: IS110 family transposase [candidate division WOR-3 bacterium]